MTTMATPTVVFPLDKLDPLPTDRTPKAIEIRHLKRQLLQQTAAIPSEYGGGRHGHIGLILQAAEYAALVPAGTDAFNLPNRPALPNFHGAAAIVATTEHTYYNRIEQWRLTTTVERQIKRQIVEACPPFILQALEDPMHGLGLRTSRELLHHLETTYGTITDDDLAENLKGCEEAWDPNEPTDTVFIKLREARAFATAGQDNISDAAAIRLALLAFEKSGVFAEAIKDWRKLPIGSRTWANMPAHFAAANKERLRETTAAQAGFQAANKASTAPKTQGFHYCWTHGLGTNAEHTSKTCSKPATGHQRDATVENMMGGNNTIRRKRGEKAIYKRPERPQADRTNTEEASTS